MYAKLLTAIQSKNQDTAIQIIKLMSREELKKAHNAKEPYSSSAIHGAAKLGLLDTVKTLIDKEPELFGFVDIEKYTLLHIAAEFNQVDMFELLINKFNEFFNNGTLKTYNIPLDWLVSKTSRDESTALHIAVIKSNENIIIKALELPFYSMFEITDKEGYTVFGITAKLGQDSIFNLLLDYKPTLVLDDSKEGSVLQIAIKHHQLSIVETILSSELKFPEHLRSSYSNPDLRISTFLVEREDIRNETALFTAAKENNIGIFKKLYEFKPELAKKLSKYGLTILNFALKENKEAIVEEVFLFPKETVQWLLNNNNNSDKPIHIAVRKGMQSVFKKLHNLEPESINSLDHIDFTLLHTAAKFNKEFIFDELLNSLIEKMSLKLDKHGHTALGVAANFGNHNFCLKLLELSNLEAQLVGKNATELLYCAIEENDESLVGKILSINPKLVLEKNEYGKVASQLTQNENIIKLILKTEVKIAESEMQDGETTQEYGDGSGTLYESMGELNVASLGDYMGHE